MHNFRIANSWNALGLMSLISGVLIILLVLGFYTEIFSRTSPEKFPHPIFIPFEKNCTGTKDKKLSYEAILQIKEAHAKWLENPTAPDAARANFCETDLNGADFSMAMLAGANFTKAKLHAAKLERANVTRANFSEAELDGANLANAMLHLTILQKAVFHNASIQDAMLFQTNLHGADLSKVKGLTQNQINMACLDKQTTLPPGLSHPNPCS